MSARPAEEGERLAAAEHPSDACVRLVAHSLGCFTAPSGEANASTKTLMAASDLSVLPVRGSLTVLMEAGLLERIGPPTSTRYQWNIARLEELAAGVELERRAPLHNSQLAKNESSMTEGRGDSRGVMVATRHIAVALATGAWCRALGHKTDQPLIDSRLESWRWDKPKQWLKLVDEIKAGAASLTVLPEQYARVLGTLFQREDRKCIELGIPFWNWLEHSHAWGKVADAILSERRQKTKLPTTKLPTGEPLPGHEVATDFFGVLEDAAARAARGELPTRAVGAA